MLCKRPENTNLWLFLGSVTCQNLPNVCQYGNISITTGPKWS